MIHADTEGLLDKCHCGAMAGFEHMGGFTLRARCTECCEQTEPDHHVHPVVVEWNLMQREKKSNTSLTNKQAVDKPVIR